MKEVQAFIDQNRDRFLKELFELIRIPSISADPAYAQDVKKAAEFVSELLTQAGAEKATVYETDGHPIVYAEKMIDENLPTVLVYGHYDVQPADPIELWDSPAFEPEVRKTSKHPDGAIFARGACDDKGQVFMHVKALESMLATNELPCNVKFMIEGEEEVGSNQLGPFCEKYKDMLSCDVILISDTSIIDNEVPSITTGLRGLSYVEVKVTGPNRDLHSGVYGGAVGNPLNILCEMIAKLRDENNHITIPGFYDKVQVVSEEERAAMNQAPFNLEEYKKDLDIDDVHGEKGYTVLEQTSIRPTLDVNGIWGGYIGEGAKTVLPSVAQAKISMRLVPDQDPHEVDRMFAEYFKSLAPPSVKVEVTPHHGGEAYVCPTDTPEYKAAHDAMTATFGKEPIPLRSGGSIPIVALFEKVLGVKSVLLGFGLDSDAIHSPNEHFGLFNFYKGIETIPHFYKNYAELKK